MYKLRANHFLLFLCFFVSACDSEKTGSDIILDERPSNLTCVAEKLKSNRNASMRASTIELPESLLWGSITVLKQNLQQGEDWYIVKQQGIIYKLDELDDDEASVETYLDLRSQIYTQGSNEQGLVGLAFHPDYENFPFAFVFYTAASATSFSGAEWRLSRFEEVDGLLDLTSEEIIIRQDKNADYHHAGTLEIGPDNYLYVSVGDDTLNNEGEWNNNNNAQNSFSLKGKMLRIDIAGASSYSIPASNPYASGTNGAPEVFATGLRNPWKFSFDSATGNIFVGDVGRNFSEEIDKVSSGKNYGWPKVEGRTCYDAEACLENNYEEPLRVFSRSDKRCIVNGYVYRGSEIEELEGQLISGDCSFGTIWMNDVYGEKLNKDIKSTLLLNIQEPITSFAQDDEGELYVVSGLGNIFRISALEISTEEVQNYIPSRLSETTCVNMENPRLPSSVAIPYRIRFPFWSDYAEKYRYIALPNKAEVNDYVKTDDKYYSPYSYEIPVGTVLVKNFEIDNSFIETRLLIHESQGIWQGYSYEWNDEQSEAYLLESSKTKPLKNNKQHYFPSSSECLSCHTKAAKFSLGFQPYQLDLTLSNDTKKENQIDYLTRLSVDKTNKGIEVDSFSGINESSLSHWVNSYLHTNCSFCHQKNGSVALNMDFRYTQSLTKLHNIEPKTYDFGINDAKIIAPNKPRHSILLNRIERKDERRMPFIGNLLLDEQAVEKITNYINSL